MNKAIMTVVRKLFSKCECVKCVAIKVVLVKCVMLLVLWQVTSVAQAASPYDEYYKSYSYEQVGDWDNSIKALMILYKAAPENYTLNLRLAYLYFAAQKYANAAKHYEKAITAQPKSISPLLGLMQVRNTQGKFNSAVEVGYRILKLDLYNYYGNLYLAYSLRMTKKYDLAEKLVYKFLESYPEDIYFLQSLGLLKTAQGDFKAASGAYDYLLLLDPENVIAKEYFYGSGATQGVK